MPLNDINCKNAKPKEKPYKKADSNGLFLNIMPNGSKYWRYKYRFMNKEKLLSLGTYPEVSLAEAREKRDQMRKLLADGVDPSQDRKNKRFELRLNNDNTFESVARRWHEHKKDSLSPSYAKSVLRRLEADIFPAIGYLPITEVKAPQILDALRQIEKRGALDVAKRALQVCGQIFRFSVVEGIAERNPVSDLRDALKPYKKTNYSALDIKELPQFLRTLEGNDARLFFLTKYALKLLVLTFVRTSELINARWEEFDFDSKIWIIPAERMKMRNPHIVPLSKQAIDILEKIKAQTGNGEFVFPSQINPKKTMSNNTLLKAIERLGYKGKTTGHGFRALAMTAIKEQLNYRHEVVDRQLAHAPRNKVDKAYDRAKFIDERIVMMQKWADYLDVICNENKVIFGDFRKKA